MFYSVQGNFPQIQHTVLYFTTIKQFALSFGGCFVVPYIVTCSLLDSNVCLIGTKL